MRNARIGTLVALIAGALGLAGAPRPAAAQDAAARGKELFQLCAQCHGANGGGNQVYLAPSIAGLGDWYVQKQLNGFQHGYRGANFDDIGGMRMRPMARWLKTEDDVKAVAAYVAAMPPVHPAPVVQGGDATKGAQYYAVCTACHGPEAKGNPAMGAPALNHASDWYLYTQLKNFRAGIRGATPGDQMGATMRPMSMTLPDEQAVKDVIAYIMTLSAKQASN